MGGPYSEEQSTLPDLFLFAIEYVLVGNAANIFEAADQRFRGSIDGFNNIDGTDQVPGSIVGESFGTSSGQGSKDRLSDCHMEAVSVWDRSLALGLVEEHEKSETIALFEVCEKRDTDAVAASSVGLGNCSESVFNADA